MRLVDADEFLKRIEWLDEYDFTLYHEIKKYLDEMPNIEAESVKHGRWIYEPKDAIEMMFTLPKCSECGFYSADGMYYCSCCGARMEIGE